MNVLLEIYGPSYRIRLVREGARGELGHEVRTTVTAVITLLCVAGIAFNVRFFVALCREWQATEEMQSKNGVKNKPLARAS